MSKLQVDDILSKTETAPTFVDGAVVPSSSYAVSTSGINIVGTASGTLIGDGSGLTGLSSLKKMIGLSIIQIL